MNRSLLILGSFDNAFLKKTGTPNVAVILDILPQETDV